MCNSGNGHAIYSIVLVIYIIISLSVSADLYIWALFSCYIDDANPLRTRKTSTKPVAFSWRMSAFVFSVTRRKKEVRRTSRNFTKIQNLDKNSRNFHQKQPFKLIYRDQNCRVSFTRDDSAISTAHIQVLLTFLKDCFEAWMTYYSCHVDCKPPSGRTYKEVLQNILMKARGILKHNGWIPQWLR